MATTTEHQEPASERITLPVDGMTCAACQANVQRALNAAPGVQRAAVNLMTNEASVTYDPQIATPESLVRAVEASGYISRIPSPSDELREADEAREREH